VLDKLIAGLKSHPDTYTLLIFRRGWKDGHAITPYAVDDKGGGQFSVLPLRQQLPRRHTRRPVDRNKNTWAYEASTNPQTNSFLYEGDAQSQTTFLSPTSATVGVQPCPFCPAPSSPASLRLPNPTGGTRRVTCRLTSRCHSAATR